MSKSNKVKCPFCGNDVQVLKSVGPTEVKEATLKDIERIESEELRGLLRLDKDYGSNYLVEGYISTLAKAIRRYQDFINGRPEGTVEEPLEDPSQLQIF